jgi:hypothetical protein
MVEDSRAVGMDAAVIGVIEKTGRLVTEENRPLLPENTLDDWQAAAEREALHRKIHLSWNRSNRSNNPRSRTSSVPTLRTGARGSTPFFSGQQTIGDKHLRG